MTITTTTTTTSEAHRVIHLTPVRYVDRALEKASAVLRRISRLEAAGCFHYGGATSFWGAWREPSHNGGHDYNLRMGHYQLEVSIRGKRTAKR